MILTLTKMKKKKKNVNIVENKNEKMYDPDLIGSFVMQFGHGMSPTKTNQKYIIKKKYYYPDKRTKKYGAQRKHSGVMGKYKTI